MKKFLFDVLNRARLLRIAQQKRVDFASREHTSLLVCRILRLAGFGESEIVPKKDVQPLLSFAQQRKLNLRELLKASKDSVEAQAHVQKLYTDAKYCDTLLKVPHALFVKYLATISHHVVEGFPDLKQLLLITLDYVRNNGTLTDTYFRTKVAPPDRSAIPVMLKVLTDINASIAEVINHPSLVQIYMVIKNTLHTPQNNDVNI